MMMGNGHGPHPAAWPMPGADPNANTNIDLLVRYAQIAERGKFDFLFLADRLVLDSDINEGPPRFHIDPILVLTAIARETTRIGLVSSASTTFSEPQPRPPAEGARCHQSRQGRLERHPHQRPSCCS